MILIHEESVPAVPDQARLSGREWTDYKRLHTDDYRSWINYTEVRSYHNTPARYNRDETFEITDCGQHFEVFLEKDSEDREDGQACAMDVPRERMLEIHAWLTNRLYGEDA